MSGDHNMNQNDFYPDWDTIKPFEERHVEDTELLRQCLDALKYEANRGNDDAYRELRDALQERINKRLEKNT